MAESRSNIEFSMIRGALILLILSIIIAGLMIFSSYYFRGQMFTEHNRNKMQFQNISQRYLAVDQEEKNIREYYPDYSRLHQQGIIGREHRLNWIEVLRNAGNRIQLPSVDYQIASQQEYDNNFPLQQGAYKIYVSSMDLNLKLLHEGDLLQLMTDLNEQARGLFSIRRCKLVRTQDTIKRSSKDSNIDAQCKLDWFNIKKQNGTELEI